MRTLFRQDELWSELSSLQTDLENIIAKISIPSDFRYTHSAHLPSYPIPGRTGDPFEPHQIRRQERTRRVSSTDFDNFLSTQNPELFRRVSRRQPSMIFSGTQNPELFLQPASVPVPTSRRLLQVPPGQWNPQAACYFLITWIQHRLMTHSGLSLDVDNGEFLIFLPFYLLFQVHPYGHRFISQ